MRYHILVAALSTLAAFSAGAQPANTRPSMEPVGSPFTYEALGATPSLRLHKRTPRAEAPTVATAESDAVSKAATKAIAREKTDAATAVENRSRAARTAKQ